MYDSQWSHETEPGIGRPVDKLGQFHGLRLCHWGWRVAAGVVDWIIIFGLPFALIRNSAGAWIAWGLLFANSGFLAAKTTQSVGKRIFGIRMVWVKEYGDPYSRPRYVVTWVPWFVGLIRIPLHLIDTVLLWSGWVAPLFNKSRGTYADWFCRSVHFRTTELPHPQPASGGRVEFPGSRPPKR